MSGVSEPEPKKQKGVASSSTSWRQKCIDTFDLQPVPDVWASKVPEGSEAAWERYYQVRIKKNEPKRPYDYDSDEEKDKKPAPAFVEFSDIRQKPANFDEESWDVECMNTWKKFMKKKIESLKSSEKLKCAWKWTPGMEAFDWEDYKDLRRGTYLSFVWSPYAIPHAVALEHYYYRRIYSSSVDFGTTWKYALVDFEKRRSASELTERDFVLLCSNGYEDTVLRADQIDVNNLTATTVANMRVFLYGDCTEASKDLTCSDAKFLGLLFASMGTCNFCKDISGSSLGYEWRPTLQQREQFMSDRVPASDTASGPPKTIYEYGDVPWLQHRVKEVSNTLGPYTRNYRPPTIEDAMGYDPEQHHEYSDEEEPDYYY